jgi:hypothetical protein
MFLLPFLKQTHEWGSLSFEPDAMKSLSAGGRVWKLASAAILEHMLG